MKPLTKWSGSKRRLLPTYLPYFQKDKSFTDLFAGSFLVSQHASSLYSRVVANDNNEEMVRAVRHLQEDPAGVIEAYEMWSAGFLGAEDPKEFYKVNMRNAYHYECGGVEQAALLILMLQSNFGGLFLRYKKFDYGYSTSYGKRQVKYDTQVLWDFHKDIRDVHITCRDWNAVEFEGFVFADPPYRSNSSHPADYGNEGKVEFQHDLLVERLKAHGSFAYCGTDLGDGWFDEKFAGYPRVEKDIKHTAQRGSFSPVKEVMVYASLQR